MANYQINNFSGASQYEMLKNLEIKDFGIKKKIRKKKLVLVFYHLLSILFQYQLWQH